MQKVILHYWKCQKIPRVPSSGSLRIQRDRAGHFWYFSIYSIIKNDFFCIFYEDKNLFLHQSYFKKPTPSQINLRKDAKSHIWLLKMSKNTSSAQLWVTEDTERGGGMRLSESGTYSLHSQEHRLRLLITFFKIKKWFFAIFIKLIWPGSWLFE